MDFELLYKGFHTPITKIDCGNKCAPYNEKRAPFCCDTRHAIPTAYEAEWVYLQANTHLWHLWQLSDPKETERIRSQTPSGQVLIECKGHLLCEREYRSLTCRAFPFYPYISQEGIFLGLSYYWEYEDRCWVISNMGSVSLDYITEFFQTYHKIFNDKPDELNTFRYHSMIMRRVFGRKHRTIPLIDSRGRIYKITPHNGKMRRIQTSQLPKFGPYQLSELLPFPDETP